MKPFHTIAIPHKDILEGRLTMDVFAADLWEVAHGRAPDEYANPEVFFNKTYITHGLTNLLNVAEQRLKGKGGDPVIQLQTPFGGGKTHSLISIYHKSKDWNTKPVVIVGTALDPKDITLWAEIERQLKGKVDKLKGNTAPGRDKIREILESELPVLILMDEVLEYVTKAAGVKIGESTLAAQSLAFIQELTETIRTLDKALLVLTLPSSVIEHYDEQAERLFRQLQKVSIRLEMIYTPVRDEEIEAVINKRLFSSIDSKKARKIIDTFLDYAEQEKILPIGIEKSEYRDRFLRSYPFQPEVILSPLIIKEKYLKDNDYVEIKKIYESSLKTRGEIRFTSKDILKESIKQGVSKGLFGFGELSYGKVVCRYFKEIPPVEIIENEFLIKEELCKKEEVGKEPVSKISEEIGPEKGEIGIGISVTEISKETTYSDIHLELKVPKGKLSDIMRTLNYLQTRFKDIDITIDIAAKDGKLTKTEYEDRIKEGLRQANIEIEREEKS